MKPRLIACAAALLLTTLPGLASAQKLVIFVRHAERADMGMASKDKDPDLSAAGRTRAAKLATMLADAGIKAIYVTPFKRTQQTAAPLAARLHLTVEPTPLSAEALVDRLKSQHAADVVLVIGHSDTLPVMIKAMGGPDLKIKESEYDNVFFVTPSAGLLTRVHY